MQADIDSADNAANKYAELLPSSIDILLLGIGEDGHIASLFPHSPLLHEQKLLCVSVKGPKAPYKRLTVTPPVIKNAKSIFILAPGINKAKIMKEAQQNTSDIDNLPVLLAQNPIWCLD